MLKELFTDIANSIRSITGGAEQIEAVGFPDAIKALSSGKYVSGYSESLQYSQYKLKVPAIVGRNNFVLFSWKPGSEKPYLVMCINYTAGEKKYSVFDTDDGDIYTFNSAGYLTVDFATGVITLIEGASSAQGRFCGTYFAVAW